MFFIIFFSVLIIDQITKYLAYIFLQPQNTIPIVNKVFYFTYLENSSSAISINKDNIWFILAVIAIIIIVAIFLGLFRKNARPIQNIGTALLCAGALGNLLDRVLYGYVIDFFDFFNLPVFNIADLSAVAGGILIITLVLFGERRSA